MTFPSTLSTFNRPSPTDRLNSPSHSALHNTVSSAVGQIEAVIGLTTTSLIGTLMYDVHSPDSNGGGHVQTANKGGTGQTNYNKGDVLVGQSSSILTKLGVGVDGQALIADSTQAVGIKWGTATPLNIQSFLSSGTWTKSSALSLLSPVFVRLWGGGGSGAGGNAAGTTEDGGGGGGGYAEGWFSASMLGSTEQVNIGLGGASVTGGSNGNVGGNTVFGAQSILTAYGGGRGADGATNAAGGGGGGSFGVGGDAVTTTPGAAGSPGYPFASPGGETQVVASIAYYGAGGGGDGAAGGRCIYGGAGGGGARASTAGAGGVSAMGGNGGAGGRFAHATAGSQPGGGGGGATGSVAGGATPRSGKGGDGMAIIYSFT